MSILFAQPIEQYVNNPIATTPAATNAHASYPASNLLTRDPTNVFRTGSALTSTVITWDLASSREVDCVALLGTNMTARATYKLETSPDNSTWTVVRNSMFFPELSADPGAGPFNYATDPRRYALGKSKNIYVFPARTSFRYLRITLSDSTNTDTFISIGRLFVGLAWRPAMAWQYGSSFQFNDTGTRDRTDQGAMVLMDGYSYMSVTVKQDFISDAEMYEAVMDFSYFRASTREMLACLDTETTLRLQKNTVYCTISDGRQISASEFNSWSQSWVLEQI